MNAAQTGIDFANIITESDSLNVFTYEYIYNGGGTGIGDVNNDGLQDIFFAGNMVSSKLYLNKGGFQFQDITAQSKTTTSYWCTGVAMTDINADGLLDIYVCTAFPQKDKRAPNLFFINKGIDKNGVPVFAESAADIGLNDSAYSTQATFFDYDHDGDLDVYECINSVKESDRNAIMGQKTNGMGSSQDKFFRNDGVNAATGLPHFTNVSKEAGVQTEGWGLGVIVKDFNRDGWGDVYVANDFQSNDHLYINNHDGTFTNRIADYLAHQCHNAMGVDMADCNNDGLEDICVVDMLPDDNLRQKTMFGAIPNDKYESALRMGYQPQFVRNVLQLNNGLLPESSHTPAFGDIGYMAGIAATDWSWSPLWADVDMDGWRDLLITNGYVKDITDLDFATYSNEYGMFGTKEEKMKRIMEKAKDIGEVKKRNWLFHNNKELNFSDSAAAYGLTDISFTNGAAYTDLDNDGDLDLVMNNLNDPAFVYRNNSIEKQKESKHENANFLSVQLQGTKENSQGIGAKITLWQNGVQQFAEQALQRGYLSSVDERIYFGFGSNKVIDSLQIEWTVGRRQVLKNIPVNQFIILKETDATEKKMPPVYLSDPLLHDVTISEKLLYTHQENDYMDFDYQYTLPHKYSLQGPSLSVADINGDGLDDIYTGGASRHSGYFFVQTKNGFVHRVLTDKPANKLQEETGTLLFDADNDGDNDLYCVAGGNEFGDTASYQDLFFVNDGKGNFKEDKNTLPNTTASGSCIAAADYDHDGDLDLFVGGKTKPHQYPLAERSYLLRNDSDPKTHNIKFTDITSAACSQLQMPGMVCTALFTDYNNDGFADLLITGECMPLQLYRNKQGNGFEPVTVHAFNNSNGWYNSLAAGDFDNDGDMDYIAGNMGLNSKYRASVAEPVTVRYNDYNKDGARDAFLFSYNSGTEYPYQTRAVYTEQISTLKKKIFYYHDFGKMTYTDIFSQEQRKDAKELKAYQMASLYIENTGNNTFSIKPLPILAQTSPMFGILPFDIDADGNLDIMAVGNSYAPEALTGRYDASVGWVLRSDGNNNFTYMPPSLSGFMVSGDAKSFVKLMGKNKNCVLVAAQNKGPLKAFETNTTCIPLQPNDVYVIYTLNNGTKRKEEFYYGSTYYAQSARCALADDAVKAIDIYSTDGNKKHIELR